MTVHYTVINVTIINNSLILRFLIKKGNTIQFIKKWLLVVAMSLGVIGYFVVDAYVIEPSSRHAVVYWVTSLLPYLLFVMLFLEFSKINPRDLFPKKWHHL